MRIKKNVSLILIFSMIITTLAGLGTIKAFAFDTGVVIEAEDGALSNSMFVYQSPTAGSEECISVITGATLTDPASLANPDARYTINIPVSGNYKIYLRGYSGLSGSNSFWTRWDGASYAFNSASEGGSTWSWFETTTANLAAGNHTLDICHRTRAFYIDLIVVTPNLSEAQKANIEANLSINTSMAVSFNTTGGSVMLEAESATLNSALYGTVSDALASNDSAIRALIEQKTPIPQTSMAGAAFNIVPDCAGVYDVWIRYSAADTSQDSLYIAFDESNYTSAGVSLTSSLSDYQWEKVYTTGNLYSGKKYNFKLHPREASMRIDKIIITMYPFFTPSGEVPNLDNISDTYSLPNNIYPSPTITPPSSHPRLMFKSTDITQIQANMQEAQNVNMMLTYNNYLQADEDGILSPVLPEETNYDATVLANIEAYALKYALDSDVTYGNKAVNAMGNYLKTLIVYDNYLEETRNIGHVIYVASEVYDWCYPLLSDSDKNNTIVECEALASRMEIGYPPSAQGAVTGHAGEAELMRDILGFAIATYNERPDIYNYVAGRLLSEFIEPRDYWFVSNTHYQGDSYGNYRHAWEMAFQFIIKRMSGVSVFSEDAQYVPYQWIYTYRPDGQMFRNGDSGQNQRAEIGTYWNSNAIPAFYSSNFYNNSFVKNLYTAAFPNFNGFSSNDGWLSPVTFLLINNPDLSGQSHTSTLPLTKFFGSPYGMMVARTGWSELGQANVDLDSDIAMAQMIVGEQWSANHQHLDAGSFQLYYKGPLAIDSGVYDSYFTNHDLNYHKDTIAHNSLLIYNPNEEVTWGVNSGGQRKPGGEVKTFYEWMNNGYDTGSVLDHAYDESSTVPQYSYIKGDITRAYSNKVSEVLRSMQFMPLDDENHPAAFIVMDKVTSTNPAFKKTWLLHTQQNFTMSGNTAVIKCDTDGYNGRMDLSTLLPANATYGKIGGEGNEFNVNGINYSPTTMGSNGCEHGTYRLEVSPNSANATDYFLNVMQVSDASGNATPLSTTLIETDQVAGVKISDRVAIFGKSRDKMNVASFTIPGTEQDGLKITVAGISAGTWYIYRDNQLLETAAATVQGGILSFEGGAGEYVILKGTVTNLVTRFDAANPTVARATAVSNNNLYAVQGSSGAPYTRYDSSTGYMTDQARIDAVAANNPYFTSDKTKWSYGDRNCNAVYNGQDSSNPIFAMTQYTLVDTTDPILLGGHVTKILTLNSEKTFTPEVPDVYSFTINMPATVYAVVSGTPDTNFVTNNGWIKKTDLLVKRASTPIIQGTDSLYYSVPTGDSNAGNVVYSKHFAEGTVNIPSRGASASRGILIFIVWDE